MRSAFFRRRPASKSSARPTAHRRLAVDRLEDRLAPAAFTVNSLLDTASPPAGTTTLRSAIAAANADHNTDAAHPDIITFSVTGAITLTSALPTLTDAVSIQGPGASVLTVLGNASGISQPIVTVSSPATAAISGLTLDGNGHVNSGIAVGSGASLTFQDATVQNANTNGNGGGISITGGSVAVTRGQFIANYASAGAGEGGAVANVGGSLTVTQSTFDSNFAGQVGGGIYDTPASGGGGGTLTVVSSTFSNNITEGDGGGLAVFRGGQATVVDSTFTGNFSGLGGGIAVLGGGASNVALIGSTVTGNTAGPGQSGGGLFVQVTTTATVRDTIIATNSGGDVYGSIDPTSGFNLIGDGTSLSGPINGVNGNSIGTTAQPPNPRLGPLQNNGGPVKTMALLPGSPALDRGGPSTVLDGLTTFDECGTARVVAQSFIVPPSGGDGRDIGAYELPAQTVPTVLTVNTLSDAAPQPGALTLRQAVQAADGLVSLSSLPAAQVSVGSAYFDQIQFSVAGTIALTSALPAVGYTGVGLQGPGASSLTILGDGQADPILTVAPGGAAVVSGLTLDGNSHMNSGISVGTGASLIFQDATVQNANTSGNGGAVSITGGSAAITRGRFLANYASAGAGDGGAVSNVGGTLTVTQSTFDSNFAGGVGGGLFDAPGTTGGGGTLAVSSSTFSNNIAEGDGGGLAVFHGGQATVADSTFSGNFSGVGGGIAVLSGGPSNLALTSSTVANNTAGPGQAGGGLFVQVTTTATVKDTIIATNSGGDVYGSVDPASAFNLIGDGTSLTGPTNGVNGNQIGTTAAPINPLLGSLANNGGPTKTMALLPGSPALDHGGPDSVLTGLGVATDQRGLPRVTALGFVARPSSSDGRDVGAVEAQPTTLTVNTTSDVASPPVGTETLRQAIQVADGTQPLSSVPLTQVTAGDAGFYQITFALPASSTIALTSQLPAITGAVEIQGPGASALTVLGNGNGTYQPILNVNSPATASISGLTLDGNSLHNSGIAVGTGAALIVQDATIQNTYSAGNGSGLAVTGGTVTVTRGRFAGDYTDSSGGCIANVGGTLTVSQSTFDSGFAGGIGGGIYDAPGTTGGGGTLTVANSTFSNNIGEANGGGLAVYRGGQATITDSTFAGNFSGVGGGIAVLGSGASNLVLNNSTLAGNTAGPGQAGGGLFVQFGTTATVRDTIIAGNSGGDVYGAVVSTSDHNLIGDGSSLTGLTNGANGNLIGTAAAPINPLLGSLTDNGGPTKTMALLPGSPAIDAGSNPANLTSDQRGFFRVVGPAADIGAFEVQVTPIGFGVVLPPAVQSVIVNGGAAQRSMVTTVAVTFSALVNFTSSPAAAFTLTHVSDGAAVSFTTTVSAIGGETVVTLTGFTGPATQNGSLADGQYTLRVLSNQVSANGLALDGGSTGTAGVDYVSPTDTQGGGPGQLRLYRLFGDATGDGIVDQLDLGQFRAANNSTFGNPAYVAYLDYDNSGTIDQIDLGQFRARNNSSVFAAIVPGAAPPPSGHAPGTRRAPAPGPNPATGPVPAPGAATAPAPPSLPIAAPVRTASNVVMVDPYYLSLLDAADSGVVDQVALGQFRTRNNTSVL